MIATDPTFVSPTEMRPEHLREQFTRNPIKQIYMLSLLRRSAASVAKKYVKDPAALKFFSKLTSVYTNTEFEETPAILSATMFIDNHEGGTYYPAGGALMLTGRLERALERLGGDIRYDAEVARINLDGRGRTMGVELVNGEKIPAENVIFSGTVWDLYERLLPQGAAKPSLLKKIDRLRLSPPTSVVYGAVLLNGLPSDAFPIEVFADSPDKIDERDVTCYFSSLEDSTLCPDEYKGSACAFLLIGPAKGTWPSAWTDYKTPQYEAAKEAEKNRMINLVTEHFPDFKKNVLFAEAGTPTTIERYLRKKGGAVAGPLQAMGQEMLKRPHATTRFPGLFMCGESTVMGTGTSAVTISGISAANMVLRQLGLEEYRAHPQAMDRVKIIPRGARGNPIEREELSPAAACQWCENATCAQACPARLDIPNIMRKIYCSNFKGALALARRDLGAADVPCATCPQKACLKACVLQTRGKSPLPIYDIILALGRGKKS
jgi:prolycopene isomerase